MGINDIPTDLAYSVNLVGAQKQQGDPETMQQILVSQQQQLLQMQQQMQQLQLQLQGATSRQAGSTLFTQHQQQQQQQRGWSTSAPTEAATNVGLHTLQSGLGSAGLDAAALGVVDGDFNNLFSAQGGVAGIDNVFLKNMHLYTEAGKRKRSDNWLRPDYHLDTDKKYEDMSVSDLLYDM